MWPSGIGRVLTLNEADFKGPAVAVVNPASM
jgi:hypothetical protein